VGNRTHADDWLDALFGEEGRTRQPATKREQKQTMTRRAFLLRLTGTEKQWTGTKQQES
jgi:hypothetical protein